VLLLDASIVKIFRLRRKNIKKKDKNMGSETSRHHVNNMMIDEQQIIQQVKQWNTETTCKYILAYAQQQNNNNSVSINHLNKFLSKLKSKEINGQSLMELNDSNIKRFSLSKEQDESLLLECALHVRTKYNNYNNNELSEQQAVNIVAEKLMDSRIVSDENQAIEIAKMLSSKDALYNTFLSIKENGESKTLEDLLDFHVNSVLMNEEVEEEEEDALDINDIMHSASEELQQQIHLENEFLTVKLVIVGQHGLGHRFIQKISPVLNRLSMAPDFGSFHVALIIGSWYFDWTTSSVIIPRKCYSQSSVLAIDLGQSIDYEFTDDGLVNMKKLNSKETFEKVAEAIAHWNSIQRYTIRNNCHHFVKDLCDRLNLRLDFTGLLGTYMDNLRRNGHCEMCIDLKNHILKRKINVDKILFESHKQLDEFVHTHYKFLTNDDVSCNYLFV
jgi:hypothetical protein